MMKTVPSFDILIPTLHKMQGRSQAEADEVLASSDVSVGGLIFCNVLRRSGGVFWS